MKNFQNLPATVLVTIGLLIIAVLLKEVVQPAIWLGVWLIFFGFILKE